jgi:hypothetical protein
MIAAGHAASDLCQLMIHNNLRCVTEICLLLRFLPLHGRVQLSSISAASW